jgi:hypothetical protein
VNECEGSLYNVLREERVTQWSQQGREGTWEGWRQIITSLIVIVILVEELFSLMTLHTYPCNKNSISKT